ncbi:GFA family protein [Oceaniglobus roseus]|uniref:GFA family protein n=1 Tax=Oceaniglobus roseus TaxID=1737570 RepID=UPI000C7F0AEF|nr:aldehyde-activating protein [Kandeliimicrobium roseum]
MLTVTCDCGAVTVTAPGLPDEVNACPCGWCQRIGARWGYYRRSSVTVTGETQVYLRASRRIEFHRCLVCGAVTHWLPNTGLDRAGVNLANLDPSLYAAVPVVAEGP